MSELIISKLGGIMGWSIIICFALAISNYVIKFINRKYGKRLRSHPTLGKYYNILFKSLVKYHKVFGFLTILFIGIHFTILFNLEGLNIKGAVAAFLMIFIILQGSYGAFVMKKRNKVWLYAHRTVALALLFAIMFHVL